MVGLGLAFRDYGPFSYTRTPGPQMEQNTFTAELAAVAMAGTRIPALAHHEKITVLSSNQAALLAIYHPKQ